MKSEERHRLQENELERFGVQAKDWFEKYGTMVLVGVCGVAIVAGIAFYVMRSVQASSARGWTELRAAMLKDQQAEYPTELLTVWRNYPDSPVGAWAVLHCAEMRLQRFSFQQFEDREASNLELSNDDPQSPGVEQQFRAANAHPNAPDDVKERALYGLATTLEILSDGSKEKTDGVVEVYQNLLDRFGDGVYADIAARRIEQLERDGTSEFYAWFRKQNPSPDDPERGPSDGLGGSLPDIPEDLRLKIDLPEVEPDGPELGGPALGTPGDEKPEEGADEKPTEDTPPETPGSDADADDKPTEETPAPESSDPASP